MAIQKTILLGENVLRETAKSVENTEDQRVQEVITDLVDSMRDKDLIGMAAPQIGVSLRIFVTEVRETEYRKVDLDELRVYINPKITNKSEGTKIGWEGCGSIPGLFGQVERYTEITVAYTDREGASQTDTVGGFLAVVIQHETDHLDGIMFTDISDPKTFVSGAYYIKHIRSK